MSNNFEWQKIHTEQRIEARLREADNYRLATQNTGTRGFQVSIFKIVRLQVTRAVTVVQSLVKRVNTAPSGQADHTGKPIPSAEKV